MPLAAQYAVILLAVLASLGYLLQSRAPALSRRLRVAIAVPLVREGRPPWLRRIARWIAPPVSGKACGDCGGCGS